MSTVVRGRRAPISSRRAAARLVPKAQRVMANLLMALRLAATRLVTWLRYPPLRGYELAFSERYSRFRDLLQMRRFRVLRRGFGITEWRRGTRESASILKEFAKLVLPQLLLSLLVVALLFFIEHLFFDWVIQAAQSLTGDGVWATTASRLRQSSLSAKMFTALGGVMAPLGALFLGLYFTAVSVVASTVYARAPNEVRQLFMQERASAIYLRLLSWCTVIAVLALVTGVLGFSLGFLNLLLLILLAISATLSFVPLGLRVLHFFDPGHLTLYLHRELAKWVRAATPDGYRWRDASFQAHYHTRTARALRTYAQLVSLTGNQSDARTAEMLCRVLLFMPRFAQLKLRIPPHSQWHRQTYKHPRWLTTASPQMRVPLVTDTRLAPETVPDAMWLEKDLARILVDALPGLLKAKAATSAYLIASGLRQALHGLAHRFAVDESLLLLRSFHGLVFDHLERTPECGLTDQGADRERHLLGILDCCAHGATEILLGLSTRLEQTPPQAFGKAIGGMRWRRAGAIYMGGWPTKVVRTLESLRDGLLFEKAVEGKSLTPGWYLQELSASAFVDYLKSSLEPVLAHMEACFGARLEALLGNGQVARSATLIEAGLEACNKCVAHFAQLKSWHEGMVQFHRVPQIRWPDIDWDGLTTRIAACRESLLHAYARLAPSLAGLPVPDECPDYFGHAYMVLAEESYRSMASGDDAMFAVLFPSFFKVCLSSPGRLPPLLHGQSNRLRIVYSSEPMADLLALSGIAIIYSELDGRPCFNVVKTQWDAYLNAKGQAGQVVELIYAEMEYRDSLPGLMPRDTLRTRWTMDLRNRLSAEGLLGWVRPPILSGGRRPEPPHMSPIINVLTGGAFSTDKADDVFVVAYLRGRPEAAGIQLPRRSQFLVESLARYQERRPREDGGS